MLSLATKHLTSNVDINKLLQPIWTSVGIKSWFKVKQNWMSNAANDGIEAILATSYEVPEMKTEAPQLFDSMNKKYFYNALQNAVKSGQALILLRKCEDGFDGRQAYLSMLV